MSASSGVLWELAALRSHYHPDVAAKAATTATASLGNGPSAGGRHGIHPTAVDITTVKSISCVKHPNCLSVAMEVVHRASRNSQETKNAWSGSLIHNGHRCCNLATASCLLFDPHDVASELYKIATQLYRGANCWWCVMRQKGLRDRRQTEWSILDSIAIQGQLNFVRSCGTGRYTAGDAASVAEEYSIAAGCFKPLPAAGRSTSASKPRVTTAATAPHRLAPEAPPFQAANSVGGFGLFESRIEASISKFGHSTTFMDCLAIWRAAFRLLKARQTL